MFHEESGEWPDYWPSDNQGVHHGEQIFTVKESIVCKHFPGLSHWQLNLARQGAVAIDEKIAEAEEGADVTELARPIEEALDALDQKARLDTQKDTDPEEAYYLATVAFKHRHCLSGRSEANGGERTSGIETPSGIETAGSEEDPDVHPLEALALLRRVFAFTLDLSPARWDSWRYR